MANKLQVIQNGNFSNGDPVFQIGSINADGDREIAVFDLMTESELVSLVLSWIAERKKKLW